MIPASLPMARCPDGLTLERWVDDEVRPCVLLPEVADGVLGVGTPSTGRRQDVDDVVAVQRVVADGDLVAPLHITAERGLLRIVPPALSVRQR